MENNSLEAVKRLLSEGRITQDAAEEIFPELKESESEGERIRKEILSFLKEGIPYYCPNSAKRQGWAAWLEKQGKQKVPVLDFKAKDWYVSNVDGKIHNIYHSVDKVEPKFKVGDTILAKPETCMEHIPFQKKIEQNHADKVTEEEKPLLEKFKQTVYDCAWGKVTCKAEGETKEEYANRFAERFLLIVRDWADDYIEYTIQQKLRKSYDEGKEDAIKENSPAWSEEDERIYKVILEILNSWSKGTIGGEVIPPNTDRYINWFKSFKDRVQPQTSAWSEEDEKRYTQICVFLQNTNLKGVDEVKASLFAWLKDLKERYTWKPSDEQLEALEHSLGDYNITIFEDRHEILTSLYQDIKKLKGK